jgi:hypothetical protein
MSKFSTISILNILAVSTGTCSRAYRNSSPSGSSNDYAIRSSITCDVNSTAGNRLLQCRTAHNRVLLRTGVLMKNNTCHATIISMTIVQEVSRCIFRHSISTSSITGTHTAAPVPRTLAPKHPTADLHTSAPMAEGHSTHAAFQSQYLTAAMSSLTDHSRT